MEHHELISSYIDNELNHDQEQEFLISLAASEGLRRSFRSELIMRDVLHADEMQTNPPRQMRGAIFATLGLASGLAGDAIKVSSNSSVQHASIFRTLFATKVNTLLTAVGVSVSALAGFAVHDVIQPVQHTPATTQVVRQMVEPTTKLVEPTATTTNTTLSPVTAVKTVKAKHVASSTVKTTPPAATAVGANPSTSSPADVSMKPPVIDRDAK
ncbi:MAG: hypothetical protein ABI444_13150 [Candidatus Kapaibacterium sp.]|jgi:hypothetical protein